MLQSHEIEIKMHVIKIVTSRKHLEFMKYLNILIPCKEIIEFSVDQN